MTIQHLIIEALIAQAANDPIDSAQKIADLELMIKPVIQRSAEWGLKVGIGLVGAQAFYALVVRVTRI